MNDTRIVSTVIILRLSQCIAYIIYVPHDCGVQQGFNNSRQRRTPPTHTTNDWESAAFSGGAEICGLHRPIPGVKLRPNTIQSFSMLQLKFTTAFCLQFTKGSNSP